VSQLVDRVDRVDRVVVVHDRSAAAARRLADLAGDPRIDLVPARSGRRARSRAQLAGLEHTLEHHAADAFLVMGGDVVQADDVVAALLDALPGHDAVVAEPSAAPVPFAQRVGPWLRRALRALAGRERPDSGYAPFVLTAGALSRVALDCGPRGASCATPRRWSPRGSTSRGCACPNRAGYRAEPRPTGDDSAAAVAGRGNPPRRPHPPRVKGAAMANERAKEYGKSPAEWYCVLAGAALLVAGVWGFFLGDLGFNSGTSLEGPEVWGLFEVNGWHTIVHVASGLVLLAAAAKLGTARVTALAFGLVYAVVAVWGFIDGNDVANVLPVNAADNILHAGLAGAGLAAYFASEARHQMKEREDGMGYPGTGAVRS